MKRILVLILIFQSFTTLILGDEGATVAVVYNSKSSDSKSVADHYAKIRNVPANNLIGLPLSDNHTISRNEFTKTLEKPLTEILAKKNLLDGNKGTIRYLLLCWGVPFRVDKDNTIKPPPSIPTPLQRNEASVDSELALLPQIQKRIERTGIISNPIFSTSQPESISPKNGLIMVAAMFGLMI